MSGLFIGVLLVGALRPGADEPGEGLGGFRELVLAFGGVGGRGHLGEDLHAVGVVFHLVLEAPNLPFDAACG